MDVAIGHSLLSRYSGIIAHALKYPGIYFTRQRTVSIMKMELSHSKEINPLTDSSTEKQNAL